MRRFFFLALLCWAAAAQAVPIVWVVSPTLMQDGSSIAGSFTHDASTSSFSNIAMTVTGGLKAGSYNFPAGVSGPPPVFSFQQSAIATQPSWIISLYFPADGGLPEDGGTYSNMVAAINLCNGVLPSGQCDPESATSGVTYTNSNGEGTLTGTPQATGPGEGGGGVPGGAGSGAGSGVGAGMAAPQTVPTLGEYALLGLAGLMALATGWGLRQRPGRATPGQGDFERHR